MEDHGIQMPEIVSVENIGDSSSHSVFTLQPLERGFGATIGNALRRVLLSSLEGVVITAARFDGVQHEFSLIPGVTEDVSDIILNLKGVRFEGVHLASGMIHHRVHGPGEWTAGDLGNSTGEYTILNPDHHIATLGADASFSVDLRVESGRGYVPASENKRETDEVGVIPIDAVFTPIKRVSYTIKPTRVRQRVDYEKLELEVETDGSLTPEAALGEAARILQNHVGLFINMKVEHVEPDEPRVDTEALILRETLSQPVEELELSVRAHNCLRAANIKTIGDLVQREHSEMLKFRNFGRKSLEELTEILNAKRLSFGMDLSALEIGVGT